MINFYYVIKKAKVFFVYRLKRNLSKEIIVLDLFYIFNADKQKHSKKKAHSLYDILIETKHSLDSMK